MTLSEHLVPRGREPRDVMADCLQQWLGEWKVYDRVDALLKALEDAGLEILGKGTPGDDDTEPDWSEVEGYDEAVAARILDALAEYREYDALWHHDNGTVMRLYCPASVVNVLGPILAGGRP